MYSVFPSFSLISNAFSISIDLHKSKKGIFLSRIDVDDSYESTPPRLLGASSHPTGPLPTMVMIETLDEAPPAASASQERILDADAIEAAAETVSRPSARAHLDALAKKLRRDAAALERVEASQAKASASFAASSPVPPAAPAVPAPQQPPRPVATTTVAGSQPSSHYKTIDKYAFDAGKHDSPTVSVYVPLPGVGSIPRGNVRSTFTAGSFDLVVDDMNGTSYRLFKDDLDKEIVPDKSRHVVKANKVIVKLGKKKSEYGSYDFWSDLTAKGGKQAKKEKSADPGKGIMDLMKQMYDDGDDNMKKMIGETMLKQREGKLGDGMGDAGGMGGMGDMGGMSL